MNWENNNLTTVDHWEAAPVKMPRMRLPSSWDVGTRDLKRLLRQYVKPGMQVLEIGCAPGKLLSWVAAALKANVSGLDYAKPGIQLATRLFDQLNLKADLRCEDVFAHSFRDESFDIVYSFGVIEHFSDPTGIVTVHTRLLKPGGTAVMAIPNYAGLYRRIQNYFDRQNLAIHNLKIMNLSSLKRLAPPDLPSSAKTFPYGRFCPWLISFEAKCPRLPARIISWFLNCLGLLQPVDITPFCPFLVLEIVKKKS
jgi:2-polyprenyl-3-methyl-5-hydroxy-6-metoxy-1,4-benzoquinol methylase